MSESLHALRRANPRRRPGFEQSVAFAAEAARERIAGTVVPQRRARRRLAPVWAVAPALVIVAAVSLAVGLRGGVSAQAAIAKAATLSAKSAERSGTALLRITRNGELWAGTTIRWNGEDLAVSADVPKGVARSGSKLLVVGGVLYGIDPLDGGWVELGSPASIDPDSGTTPAEYLAAVREDVGGVTLRRITEAMTRLTTRELDDGTTVYSGTVAAGLIARETGFKEGHAIRVLPFGYVAHDEAADPDALLDAAVTVGADGIVRELSVRWGTPGSEWVYTVAYSRLGTTRAPEAPKHARPFPDRTR